MATFNHKNYEINIYKKLDCISLEILDTQFYKQFSKNFFDTCLLEYKMTLDNFYKIMIKSFEALIDEDTDIATIKINHSSSDIILLIHYTEYLEFNFELKLCLNTDNSLSTKELCIKKLEQNIIRLEKKHNDTSKEFNLQLNQLEKFINDFMELTITDSFSCGNYSFNESYVIKMNTPIIELYRAGTSDNNNSFINKTSGNLCRIPILDSHNVKFNTNFKMIKCHTLTIASISSIDFNYSNLPLSITKLIIKGDTVLNYFSQVNLPNLETIQLEQSTITAIHSSISHLKSVKNIRVTGCTSFQERDLLLTNGYKFESY